MMRAPFRNVIFALGQRLTAAATRQTSDDASEE
jgi:hypothetical protein